MTNESAADGFVADEDGPLRQPSDYTEARYEYGVRLTDEGGSVVHTHVYMTRERALRQAREMEGQAVRRRCEPWEVIDDA